MAREKTLKAALDRLKGVDHKLERQKKLQKDAAKRKRQKKASEVEVDDLELQNGGAEEDQEAGAIANDNAKLKKVKKAAKQAAKEEKVNGEVEGWETDESEDAAEDGRDILGIGAMEDESESDSEDDGAPFSNGIKLTANTGGKDAEDDEDDEDEDDIPFSDIESLASEDRADIIPHQRLTINNTAALQRSLKSFALPSSLPFSAIQAVTSTEPIQIPDVDDDLNRELSFYRQSLNAVTEARKLLKKEGVPFSRPADYFAEMVKTEDQMGKVKQKLVDEAARKKASADARRQRDLKKFGKAVQVAKLQERQKEKTKTLDRINTLKRKRQGADLTANEDNLFDVALEDAADTAKADRSERRAKGSANAPGRKRQKKDEKFGFGGKKRFAKSNDARSTGDASGYSVKKMKGGKSGKPRPGKSKRAKM